MSQKKYATDAERQRAHRLRVKERLAGLQPAPPQPAQQRMPPRPRRLQLVADELRTLQDGYQSWLDATPANLAEGETAESLRKTLDYLQSAIDAVESIEPPRGFGR